MSHVLFCGAYDEGPGYPRATSLRLGLEAAGHEVTSCQAPALGRDKQALLRAPWRWPAHWWRERRQQHELLAELRRQLAVRTPHCIVVPYPGHRLIAPIRAASPVTVVLDLFLSAYDTVVEDRAVVAPGSLLAAWLQQVDRAACAAADLVLLDTAENAAYVAELTGLPPERFAWLPVHDPQPVVAAPLPKGAAGRLHVLFFGTGVPLHGLATLLAAIERVDAIDLTLVGGTAADRASARRLGPRLRLEPEFVSRERLGELLAQSQLVAGVFGSGGKAQRVVPFKVVHALAAGRPVLTADTPAIAHWLDGSGAVFTTPAADAEALAAKLRELAANPAGIVAAAAAARPAYERHFGTAAQAARWRELLARLLPTQEVAA
jgi:glycosyltransferase involved in cell wall biosynthesis